MTPRTILVVDDEYAIAEVLAQILTLEGFAVDTADNGAKCLERVAEKSYDVILLDIMMPVMDGFEALGHLKAQYPDQRVIVMSAARTFALANLDKDTPFLPKPFELPHLLRLIREG